MSRAGWYAVALLLALAGCSCARAADFSTTPQAGPQFSGPQSSGSQFSIANYFQPQPMQPVPAAEPYVDLDQYLSKEPQYGPSTNGESWSWQILPAGFIYSSYLAGTKESRMSANWVNIKGDGWLFDTTLGSRLGILRYGTRQVVLPDGFQADLEGSAQIRLDIPQDIDVRSVDYRVGVPLTFASGAMRWKIGYYHLSSHLGDEFLLKNPGYPRLNFVRDTLVVGHSLYVTPEFRVYGEVGWAFHTDISEPWEFQFGLDYAPSQPTGIWGRPFAAMNAHLREEVDFGGSFTVQAGWAWRSDVGSPLLRAGAHYFNGHSNQYSFYQQHEQQFGLAIWYDF